ncbi:MAG: YggS family pyridoxal phosphate-dependent enzyme [Planctomycetes bacterium]|nr:YggS family pyridoxal phosphate-dependent enzyme [Planctomycetota bacterium]
MPVPSSTPPMPTARLAANLEAVRARMRAAAERAGRDPGGVRLVAVTKSVPAAVAAALARLGVSDLGESRADVLEAKALALEQAGLAPRWHFVGHLQRNKARVPARIAALVHSVDSPRLLAALDRLASEAGRVLDVLAQVKLADEPAKSGLEPRELADFLERARALPGVRVVGLMTMAPLADDDGRTRARAVFARAAALVREHRGAFAGEPQLSMGMSGDFELAIEEGATLVRVGSSLFDGLEPAGAAA